MSFSTLFFDLDDTLYKQGNGLWDQIRHRMGEYMHEFLGLSWEEIPLIRQTYYANFGTTLRGLQQHYQIDADAYLAYVHDLPLEDFLRPDPDLRTLLISLPQARWIFTNADADHARRVMTILGVEDCFSGIIDVKSLDYVCKPQPEAYRRAIAIAGGVRPEESILLDDSLTNLVGASQAGFTTVLVGNDQAPSQVNYAVQNLLSLPVALPELWNGSSGISVTEPKIRIGSKPKPSGDQHGS
jgi:pyrimidine 5'-nucleotidase